MTDGEWARRSMIRGLAMAALVAALPLAAERRARRGVAGGAGGAAAVGARGDGRDGQERLRCHERFRDPRAIRDCQAEFERRHRAYNEVYIEAARE